MIMFWAQNQKKISNYALPLAVLVQDNWQQAEETAQI